MFTTETQRAQSSTENLTKENEVSGRILGAAIEVHRAFGPGLLEAIYEEALVVELEMRGLLVQRQHHVPLSYRGRDLRNSLRLDLLVEDRVIVEVKSVESLSFLHEAQLLTYLRLTQKRVGLLLNFNVALLVRDGVRRKVL